MMRRAEKGDRVVESGEHPGEQRKHRLKRTRALEGEEAGDHHDGIKSALWFCFCFFLFVCVFDMFACSSSFVLSYHKKMPPPLLGSRLVYVCVANCGSFVQLDRVTVVLYFGW